MRSVILTMRGLSVRAVCLIALLGSVTSHCAAASDQVDDILTKLDHSAATFKSMSASLKQTAHTAVINEDQVESGTIRMKRSGPGNTRMLVDFTQPDAKTVQLEGQTLDIYLPNSKIVQEYSLGKNSALLEQFLLLGFGTTRKDLAAANDIQFGGQEVISGQPAVRLVLTPKSKDVLQHVQKIELWLMPATAYPIQHKIYEPGGDYHLFQFSDLKMNPNLPESTLKLNLPKGVKKETPQR